MLIWRNASDRALRAVTAVDLIAPEVGYQVDTGESYAARLINGALVWNLESGNVANPPLLLPALEMLSTVALSLLPRITAALTIDSTAYFIYLGQTQRPVTANFVEFAVTVGGTGAQTAEAGLFSTPLAPNRAGQSLTKLVATGTLDALTGTGVMRNTADFNTVIAAGVHLWAGLRTAMATNEPTVYGLTGDLSQGQILALAGAGALTGAGPFAGALIAHSVTAWQAPDLRLICS